MAFLLVCNGLLAQYSPAVFIMSPNRLARELTPGTDYVLLNGEAPALWVPIVRLTNDTFNLVFCDDGTPARLACDTNTVFANRAAVVGEAGMVNRGTCLQPDKSYTVQKNGAAIAILCNFANQVPAYSGNSPLAARLNIPSVMMEKVICDSLKLALARGETVSIRTSTDVDRGLNFTELQDSSFASPEAGAVPTSQLRQPFRNTMGAYVFNSSNTVDMNNVTLTGSVSSGFNSVGTAASIPTRSRFLFDNMPSFDAMGMAPGGYTITYSVDAANETNRLDNTRRTTFWVTDTVYCKSRWNNTTGLPVNSGTGYGLYNATNVTTPRTQYCSMFRFNDSTALDGSPLYIRYLQFGVFYNGTVTTGLQGQTYNATIYKWNDVNGDSIIMANGSEFEVIGAGAYTFDTTATGGYGAAQLYNIQTASGFLPVERARYAACIDYDDISSNPPALRTFLYYDRYSSYKANFDIAAGQNITPNIQAPVGEINASTGAINWFNGGVGFKNGAPSMALHLSKYPERATGVNEVAVFNEVNLFPNPTSDVLTVAAKFKEANNPMVTYTVVDVNGKVVYTQKHENVGSEDQITINAASFASGTYFVRISTDKGTAVRKVVVVSGK